MQVTLSSGTKNTLDATRHPMEGDKRALAELMFAAYQGTVDYSGESIEDAEEEIVKTFSGVYGKFLPSCSYVVESGSQIVCASLIKVLDQGPLLAFAMTSPSWRRRGWREQEYQNHARFV